VSSPISDSSGTPNTSSGAGVAHAPCQAPFSGRADAPPADHARTRTADGFDLGPSALRRALERGDRGARALPREGRARGQRGFQHLVDVRHAAVGALLLRALFVVHVAAVCGRRATRPKGRLRGVSRRRRRAAACLPVAANKRTHALDGAQVKDGALAEAALGEAHEARLGHKPVRNAVAVPHQVAPAAVCAPGAATAQRQEVSLHRTRVRPSVLTAAAPIGVTGTAPSPNRL